MPANYLVINSKFKPFSYAEMLQPVAQATQAHQELENQYAELATKANVWENMANEQTDPYAYKMYKTYANDLENQAGQLAREGLTPASRQNMLNMRERYSSDIVPIEQAYQRRKELVDEQRKLSAQDNTLMFNRDASTLSLDDLIRNPQLSYQSYSGAMLAKQVGTAAQNLSKEMRDNPRKWRSILGDSYYETLMQKGFRPEEIIKAVRGDSDASPILTNIVEDAINSSRIADWGDEDTLNRAYNYAREGLWNAIGETQYQNLENWRAKMDLQDYYARRLRGIETPTHTDLAINPLNIYSNRELSDEEKRYRNSIDSFSKYFYKSGDKIIMNDEGLKEYNRKESTYKSASGAGSYKVEGPTAFKTFIDSLGLSSNKDLKFSAGEAWEQYINNPVAISSRYDASKVTEYDYAIDSSQQKDMKDAIMTATRGDSLREVDYNSKSKKFEDVGEELTMNDLNSDKFTVLNTRFSPYGNTVIIKDDKGKTRRYRMPIGINTTNELNRDNSMQAAYMWQQVINTGLFTDENGNTRETSPYEIAFAKKQYNQALQEAYFYHSQLGVRNKTEEQKFSPIGY